MARIRRHEFDFLWCCRVPVSGWCLSHPDICRKAFEQSKNAFYIKTESRGEDTQLELIDGTRYL